MMKAMRAQTLLGHLTVILSLMFLVFLVLDQFNPLMNFVNSPLSQALLAALCLSGIGLAASTWHGSGREKTGQDQPCPGSSENV